MNRFDRGGGRRSEYRTSPNSAPLGRSRSAAAGVGISNTTFSGVSSALTAHGIAGVPSRRESWWEGSHERSHDAGLYA